MRFVPQRILRGLFDTPCSHRIAENLSSLVMVPSEGVTNAPNDLLSNQPLWLKPSPLKTVTAMKNQETTTKPSALTIALMTECQPKKSATHRLPVMKKNSVIPEQIF